VGVDVYDAAFLAGIRSHDLPTCKISLGFNHAMKGKLPQFYVLYRFNSSVVL